MAQCVAVAISGGRDSAVAASLLAAGPYEVLALHVLMTDTPGARAQCELARAVARRQELRFETVDLVDEFSRRVIEPFCAEYAAGRTPNPCVVCNREIKFGLLLQYARARGAEMLATGHYVRAEHHGGEHRLRRAADRLADQSYFLYAVAPASLERMLAPLGDMERAEVSRIAATFGMAGAPSSQDICFVADGDCGRFVAQRTGVRPGDIVDLDGRILGKHQGLPFCTVGQRHGLRIATGEPTYVVRLDSEHNAVVVGSAPDLLSEAAVLDSLVWTGGRAPSAELLVHAQTRYRSRGSPAHVTVQGELAHVRFLEPQRAIAPGQSVVFYDDDVVLGGGVIRRRHEKATNAHVPVCTDH